MPTFRPAPRTTMGTLDPRVTDIALALAMSLVVAVVIAADTDTVRRTGVGAYLFAAGFGALILIRRRASRTVLVVTVLAVFGYYTLGFAPIGMALPAVAALYSAAELRHVGWAAGAGSALVGVSTYFRLTGDDAEQQLTPYDLVTNVALVAAAIALGVAVRLTRQAKEHEVRTTQQRLEAERLHIARDLHDVVGHNLSVIALHSSVAEEAVGRDDNAAHKALMQVREATSRTLHDLRTTVRLLRTPVSGTRDDSSLVGTGPIGLASVGALARSAEAAGPTVDIRLEVPDGILDSAVDTAAYRIVQESLTNVLRHAAATHVTISGQITDGHLVLQVADDGRGVGTSLVPGTGLAGMRERSALLGGVLTAGNAPGGGFAITADLPARLEA